MATTKAFYPYRTNVYGVCELSVLSASELYAEKTTSR